MKDRIDQVNDFETYTCSGSLNWRANCPAGTDRLFEPAHEHEPTISIGVATNDRCGTVKRSVLVCIVLGGCLTTEPLILAKLAFNLVDHIYFLISLV